MAEFNEELTNLERRKLAHISLKSYSWTEEKKIRVLKEYGFKKDIGARWKPKYAFLDDKTDYSERGFM